MQGSMTYLNLKHTYTLYYILLLMENSWNDRKRRGQSCRQELQKLLGTVITSCVKNHG